MEGMLSLDREEFGRDGWKRSGRQVMKGGRGLCCGPTGKESGRVNGEAAKMMLYVWPGQKSEGGGASGGKLFDLLDIAGFLGTL
jgi:hypothetical protein